MAWTLRQWMKHGERSLVLFSFVLLEGKMVRFWLIISIFTATVQEGQQPCQQPNWIAKDGQMHQRNVSWLAGWQPT
eukprot:34188-Pelagomonas_calceolata.AAC.1